MNVEVATDNYLAAVRSDDLEQLSDIWSLYWYCKEKIDRTQRQ